MSTRQLKYIILVIQLLVISTFFTPAISDISSDDMMLLAPDGTNVTIHRDDYGVPHIVGDTEVGVFFGQGFAVAQDRLYQMERFRRSAEGSLAEWLGDLAIEWDKASRCMFYTEEERGQLFDELPETMQDMLASYRDGINTYLDSMEVNPEGTNSIAYANCKITARNGSINIGR